MIHAFTIDVEDYHNIIARDHLGKDGPPTPCVVDNTHRFLRWLADRSVRATFFVLGEVAETYPQLIREIAAGGHELGVHGYYHRQVFKLDRDSFRKEVADAKRLIEQIAGVAVRGHRAPAFSIMPQTDWGLEVLAEVGFEYDSSVFPIKGRRYGWPDFPRDIHRVPLANGLSIVEAPMSTVTVFGRRLPACGGGYIRHFPGFVTHWAMRRVAKERPAIVYLHPYEIEQGAEIDTSSLDPSNSRGIQRFHALQMRNRATMEQKILSLLNRFHFAPLADVIDQAMNSRAG